MFNVLVGNLRMCSIPTGKHVRAQGLFSVRVATRVATHGYFGRLLFQSSVQVESYGVGISGPLWRTH